MENGLYSNGYVNEACINKLNERILEYKIETYNNIKELAKKCRDFIKSTSLLDHIRKYEPYLYSVNKSKLNIDLTYLTPESIGHLIVGIKYMKAKIKTVEFTGELNNDCAQSADTTPSLGSNLQCIGDNNPYDDPNLVCQSGEYKIIDAVNNQIECNTCDNYCDIKYCTSNTTKNCSCVNDGPYYWIRYDFDEEKQKFYCEKSNI